MGSEVIRIEEGFGLGVYGCAVEEGRGLRA